MSTKYVRVVPSSEAAGPSLSGEVAQAFERIRERAYAIYDSRQPDAEGSDYEDWLQAERELFEIPDVEIGYDGDACRLLLHSEAVADRPLTIAVESAQVTVMGHRMADGEMSLFRRINLAELVDPDRASVTIRRGAGIEIVMAKAGAPEPAKPKAMAAAAGLAHVVAA